MTVIHDGLTVDWLGYATVRIAAPDGPVVYVDPGRYGVLTGEWANEYGDADGADDLLEHHPHGDAYNARDGDVVLVTHDHHYDPDGIRRVAAEDATVVAYEAIDPERIAGHSERDIESPEALPYDVRRVAYGDELAVDGVDVRVVPAYNRSDGPRARTDGTVGHPEGFGCGFCFTVGGVPCFWPGDSDVLDVHAALDVSLFLPSIARNFTMNRHEAADLAETLDPDLVLPIHYNTFEELGSDSSAFATDLAGRGVPVVLDERTFGPDQ